MNRYEQHLIGGVEDVVGAVSVVDVPVEDHHPFDLLHSKRMTYGDGDVVEQAEAHRPLGLGMVTRGTVRAEAARHITVEKHVHQRHRPPGRVHGRLERAFAGNRIEVDVTPTATGEALDRGDVRLRVDPGELLTIRRRRADPLVPEPTSALELVLDRDDPSRLFRMLSRVVPQRRGMREEHGRRCHLASTVLTLEVS